VENTMKQRWSGRILFISFLIVCGLLIGAGSAGAKQGPPGTPPGIARGQEAIVALGDRLPEVAAEYGMSAGELQRLCTA
jgi:hypothetical protein